MNILVRLVSGVLTLAGWLLAVPVVIAVIALINTCPVSVAIRKKYVDYLMLLFEYGRKKIHDKISKNAAKDPADAENRNGVHNQGNAIIKCSTVTKDDMVLLPNNEDSHNSKLPKTHSLQNFVIDDCLDYVHAGVEAIIEDEVTQRFVAAELKSWNLLTRTNRRYEFINIKLTILWIIGFLVRYVVLMPARVATCFLGVVWLTVCTGVVGFLPEGPMKRAVYEKVSIWCFNFLACALTLVAKFHNRENIPKGGICVANHTTPVDVMVLHCDKAYALIGQSHGGFLGVIQRALGRASSHIWFERSEVKDREAVAKRLKRHVDDPAKLPILIFPEGTCINNTSVMQFKKGSFEVGSVVYPVAIKYDSRFTDAFWNSSRHSMMQYLYMMMTSWALVCDVWYLPPMTRKPEESAIDFANRVKAVIAQRGGLVDLAWDGQLKRLKAKKEWKQKQQEEFSKRLKVE